MQMISVAHGQSHISNNTRVSSIKQGDKQRTLSNLIARNIDIGFFLRRTFPENVTFTLSILHKFLERSKTQLVNEELSVLQRAHTGSTESNKLYDLLRTVIIHHDVCPLRTFVSRK